MSYILDALRKSQQARQPGTKPRTGAVHNISLPLPLSGWWLALGIVLLLALFTIALFLWRSTVGSLPDPSVEPAPSEPVATAPTPEPATPAVVQESPAPSPVVAKQIIPVFDLSKQAKVPVPAPPPKKAKAVRTEKKPVTTQRVEANKTSVATAAIPLATDNTPLLQEMPQDFQRALPPLAVTIHVYSHDQSQRILFINNREYRQGSEIEGEIRVEDIVPDGAVLSFRGERFKLSRPR
ncbi:MAG: general secretion pathway protein GspB [Sulfuricaulis sp.]|nr:general secretion pathway protein GspB [Sulfuricaulis sp.]